MTVQPTMLRPATPRPSWQVVVGLLLPLPALILLITTYVEPAIWTIRTSFGRFTGIRGLTGAGDAPSAGLDNYNRAFDGGLGGALGYVLTLAVVPLLIVLLLAPALAWAAHRSGRAMRWVTRGALVIPLAAFAPFGIALASASSERGQRWAYWAGTFGVVAAVAVLIYLAALRTSRGPWPGVIIGGVLAVLAVLGVVAAVLQDFTFGWSYRYVADGHATPATLMYESALIRFDLGTGAAISAVLLVALLLLGLLATLLVIVTGLRLEARPAVSDVADISAATDAAHSRRGLARPGAAALLVVVLVVTGVGLWPWLSHLGDSPRADVPSTWVNTWLPPVISTLVGVTAAALAAFGISGLRPLGRHSEWLLLPFGLFLFVGGVPLALRAFAAGATAGRLDSFLALIPPSRLAIPALFVLALLFRGQALRRDALMQQNRPASWWPVVLPALPMLALAYVATWFVQAQDLIWPLITSSSQHPTAQFVMLQILQYGDVDHLPYGRLLPIPLLLLLLLAGVAAQLFYLDKVALHHGAVERDHPPRT
ncbi:sugar ABC transporter permease [Dactylosporangium sp. NPDC048998]|uniref:sugar ABC transporter permease n=1 Tax=Dactylosporangium sp. NPDC048998 TaxID=3363976 RepID=UPI00371C4434